MSGFTPDQLEARRRTLGASEIPAVIGISPYKGAFEVWLEKRGLEAPRSEDTPWQKWGLKMEPVIAEEYVDYMAETHGQIAFLEMDGRTSVQVKGQPWSCTPDRLVALAGVDAAHDDTVIRHAKDIPLLKIGVDFKQSRFGDGYGATGTEEVPAHIWTQCQWSMMVTDLPRWDVAALIGGSDFRVYHILRDTKHIRMLLTEARAFWDCVEQGIEPPLDASKGAKEYLAAKFPQDEAVDPLPVYDDNDTIALIQELRLVNATYKQAEERKATLENRIKFLIGDRPGIITPLGKATWKRVKDSVSIDWEALAKDALGEKVNDYIVDHTIVKPGYRRFLFKPETPAKEE
jgi:predicted phage-related endonuclease